MRKQLHFILLSILLICCSVVASYAQSDSVSVYQLGKAEIKGNRRIGTSDTERFSVGGNAHHTDSTSLSLLRHTSLTELVNTLTPVFVRENGNGMMSSVSLRGTASSHTVVTWNDVAINSLTMGQTDFNHLPVFFFDDVNVYPGGEGALYGNGSIGGTIGLKTQTYYKEGIGFDFQQTFGSYTNTFSGGKLQFKRNKWSAKTALLYQYSKNDFKFRNDAVDGFPVQRQNNSSYDKFGILQEVYYNPSKRSTLSAKIWYMNFYREIQPMKSANNLPRQYDTIRDRNLLSLVNFNHRADWLQLSTSMGYLYDRQLFRNDVIATNRFVARAEGEKQLFKTLTIKIGAYTEYIVPDVYAYDSNVTEWRGDVYALFRYDIDKRLEVSLNLRQSFVSRQNPPFTPSVGVAYRLIDNDKNRLKVRSTLAKSFRAPTLNDRYWGSSINSDLQPETGVNIEAGLDYSFNTLPFKIEAQATVFRNKVDNWILWLPRGNIWKPMNMREVNARGFEAGINIQTWINKVELTANANYSYVFSEIVKGTSNSDPNTGIQLPLVPKNRWTTRLHAEYSNAFAQLKFSYTGKTYSTDKNMKIKDYTLAYLTAGYNFAMGKHKLMLSGNINNLFNKDYESIMFFAMPGRNWSISLRYVL